jgi:A/G-specific adenine glycosylase
MAVRKSCDNEEIVNLLLNWGKSNFRCYPWRNTENKFHALIAEVMLQRTKAEQVLPVYITFTSKYVTPEEVCFENSQTIEEILKPLGLHWRVKLILNLSKCLSDCKLIPDSFDGLTKLPAIGQYVASAYLSLHNNQWYPLIDANTVRVWGRVFGFETNAETRRKKSFKELVTRLTPPDNFRAFNYAILDFSAIICGKKPLCNKCVLSEKCLYNLRNIKKA